MEKKYFNRGVTHQGDVGIRRLGDLSMLEGISLDGLVRMEPVEDVITLVEGEASGHYHQLRDPKKVTVYKEEGRAEGINSFIVIVHEETSLTHYHITKKELTGEHSELVFPPGLYEFGSQRESNVDKRIARVAD